MFSGDGEYVDFLHTVLLEGPVEVSCGEGLRIELILLPLGKFAWLCEETTLCEETHLSLLKTLTSPLDPKSRPSPHPTLNASISLWGPSQPPPSSCSSPGPKALESC